MLKSSLYFLNVVTYVFALHNFLPNGEAPIVKKSIYTNFVPPSAERFFATPAAVAPSSVVPSTKAVAPLLPAAASGPYLAPYTYQTQYSPYAFKQYPYYPGVFYPPQPFVYPHSVGPPPSPVVYIPRYPAPAESGNEQGSSSGSTGGWSNYIPSNWQSWGGNWGSYFPSWTGSGSSSNAEGGAAPGTPVEGSSSQAGASPSSSHRGGKPEKLETAEVTSTQQPSSAPSQDSVKSDADKNAVTVELPEQQYVLVGQPQFFGHFAAFPADRDPTTLNGAAKGAVSSFLFYNKDQNQQVVPQKFNEIPNAPGSASLAYQRFLLLSKQRSEDGPKPVNKSDSTSSTTPASSPLTAVQTDQSQPSNVTSTATVPESDDASSEILPEKSSVNEIARVTPNAVAYAGIGGIAGAAPVGTAFIANSGLASSAPRATAIAGTSDQSPDFVVAPAKTVYIARYTPQRKYHIDAVAL